MKMNDWTIPEKRLKAIDVFHATELTKEKLVNIFYRQCVNHIQDVVTNGQYCTGKIPWWNNRNDKNSYSLCAKFSILDCFIMIKIKL